jgi:Na+-driven multidrug efflux pump
VDGFAFAAETLVGNCLGRRDFSGARLLARRILLWGSVIGCVFLILYSLVLEVIARAFTDHLNVIEVILSLKFLIAFMQPLNGAVFVFDGIFIGANDMKYLFKAMALALLGIFVPAALVLVYWLDWGIQGCLAGLQRPDDRPFPHLVASLQRGSLVANFCRLGTTC